MFAILLGLIPSHLVCCNCERRSVGTAAGWQGRLVDLDDDGRDEVVFFCPGCAAREFGTRGTLLDGPECDESP
ncbi:MAG: hypothetical protein ACYDHH_12590 [Solirubrobacteraceae bacterium]